MGTPHDPANTVFITDACLSNSFEQGPELGKCGIDVVPSEERSAPVAPPEFQFEEGQNPESLSDKSLPPAQTSAIAASETAEGAGSDTKPKQLPRETGHDIGMGSPVPLSAQAVEIITRLRNQKVRSTRTISDAHHGLTVFGSQDEGDDWSRWRDVVFRAKGRLTPKHIVRSALPPQNKRRRGGEPVIVLEDAEGKPVTPAQQTLEDAKVAAVERLDSESVPPAAEALHSNAVVDGAPGPALLNSVEVPASAPDLSELPAPAQLTEEEATAKVAVEVPTDLTSDLAGPQTYCSDCYLPLYSDPKPEALYIFLHALRYTTSLGCFETEMPAWAAKGWKWDKVYE
jgi:tRNA pseudouridine32 synthase